MIREGWNAGQRVLTILPVFPTDFAAVDAQLKTLLLPVVLTISRVPCAPAIPSVLTYFFFFSSDLIFLLIVFYFFHATLFNF